MAGFRLQTSGFRFRASGFRLQASGFTLVELLLVITIIGILAGISVTVTRQVYHTARVAKTDATLQKLDSVILEMYANYENRRVPSPNFGSGSTVQAQVTQAARLWFLRDMIRMEMPSNWTEVSAPPVQMKFQYGPNATTDTTPQWVHADDSPLRLLYKKTYDDAVARSGEAAVNRYAPAKCLFLVVMYGNPEVRELFFDSEIATDDDGLSYFVDGWGNPIYFLRWAPGLVLSDRQPTIADWASDAEKATVAERRPDPLDPTEVGGTLNTGLSDLVNNRWVISLIDTPDAPLRHGWTLLPVVMSSGGVRENSNFDADFGIILSPPGNVPAVDPFNWALGAPDNTVSRNYAIIHNHSARR
ncbi:MAG: type II secretion system GspH family protein [Planctomycetaceae bacterium]|nr:type II secretion system GspH family protein [Planctomycetaceae bacterium]